MFLKFIIAHWRESLIAALLAIAVAQYEISHKVDRQQEKAFEALAAELKLVKAVASTRAEILASMSAKEKAVTQKIEAGGGRVSSKTTATVTIKDQVTAPAVYGPVNSDPLKTEINWRDPYGRFALNLPSGLFTRNQSFSFSTTVYVAPDGTTRFANSEMREFSPTTGEEIPSTGVNMKLAFQTVLEKLPAPGPWHVRVVGIGIPGAVGAGGQVNPWRGLIGTLGAVYGKSDGIQGLAGLGWRLRLPFWDSTVGISGLAAFGKGGLKGVPGVTIEVSR